MKHKFDGIDPTQVLQVAKNGMLLLNGEPITEIELTNLQQEVKALKNFRVWRIMQETVRERAIEKGLLTSTKWEETLAGKMMIHNLGLLKSIADVLEGYTIPHKVAATQKRTVN